MNRGLPIWIIEPAANEKKENTARKLVWGSQKGAQITETIGLDDIKGRLKKIREYSRDNANSLWKELGDNLAKKYPQTPIKSADDFTDAAKYIVGIADGIKVISTSNSRSVSHELKAVLEASGFSVVNSYLNEFEVKGKKTISYWELPYLFDKDLKGTFEVSAKMEGLEPPEASKAETRDYLAVLGVNAVSAEDGTVVLLEHFSNILGDLRRAKKVILVIGIDKIVRNKEEALFQAKCMGIFGLESVVLNIPSQPRSPTPVTELAPISTDGNRELHIVILDNDRTSLLQSKAKDLFLCIGCTACNLQCPARLSGKPLSPREIVLNLKKHLHEFGVSCLEEDGTETPTAIHHETSGDGVITGDEIWACTTCRACMEACPVEIRHIDSIVGLRQNLVMEQTIIPDTAKVALRSIESRGHPWRGTRLTRTAWEQGIGIRTLAEDRNFDVLYWVGCTEALEDRSMRVAQAMGRLMKKAGIKVGFLGDEESCCGEPARRLGNEYLFQMQVEKNIELLKNYDVKRIVAGCPHCYHALKNEYQQFGGNFEVMHHTQFIAKLIQEGKLAIANNVEKTVTFHDPCYLGRYNGIYDPPRWILRKLTDRNLVEMEQNRNKSFCCGGGGGRMWLEERIGRRISEMRLERALETGAGILATACPYCLQMFEDAIKAKDVEQSLKAMDIAELVEKSALPGT